MKLNYELTDKIKTFIKDSELEEIKIGCSDSQVFRINKENNIYYLKVAKYGLLTSEYKKLSWLKGKLKVPEIVLYDKTKKVEYLITKALKGEMVCSKKYEEDPIKGIKIIKEAFDNIYSVDIKECPFDVSIDYKLNLVKNNVENKIISIDQVDKTILEKYKTLENILDYLIKNKFYDELCFSHGDTSLPNIFAKDDQFAGFIDVGECGIADKWFDLAICEKSIVRNYGKKYVKDFYDLLGIKRDKKKVEYYLLMMQLYL